MVRGHIAIDKLSHRLTDQDASFIYAESRNGPLHVGSLSFFEDEIEFSDLIRHFKSRLHLVPRYRERLMPVPFNLDHATLEEERLRTIASRSIASARCGRSICSTATKEIARSSCG